MNTASDNTITLKAFLSSIINLSHYGIIKPAPVIMPSKKF